MPEQWIFQPGLPDNAAHPDPAAFAAVDAALRAFQAGGPPPAALYARWNWTERLHFLKGLNPAPSRERLGALDRALGLSASGNSEVLFAWLRLALTNRYDPAVPAAERFLLSMGRRKFVQPLYQAHGRDWDGRSPSESRGAADLYAVTAAVTDRAAGRWRGAFDGPKVRRPPICSQRR